MCMYKIKPIMATVKFPTVPLELHCFTPRYTHSQVQDTYTGSISYWAVLYGKPVHGFDVKVALGILGLL